MSLSSSLNELIIRGHQIKMHAVMDGLYGLSEINPDLREQFTDWLLDLHNVDTCLNYYINYERSANMFVNEARLDNAKLVLENHQLKEQVAEMDKKLQRCLDTWESRISK
jgi:hypothetical protein